MQFEFDVSLQKLNSEMTDRKIQFEKQNALSQQQLEYANKKIETLGKEKENITSKSEEKLREVKAQFQEEHRQNIQRINEERLTVESKY